MRTNSCPERCMGSRCHGCSRIGAQAAVRWVGSVGRHESQECCRKDEHPSTARRMSQVGRHESQASCRKTEVQAAVRWSPRPAGWARLDPARTSISVNESEPCKMGAADTRSLIPESKGQLHDQPLHGVVRGRAPRLIPESQGQLHAQGQVWPVNLP